MNPEPNKPGLILRLKVTLLNSEPAIWRRILVPDGFTLPKLHKVLQIVMGWQDYHMHNFTIDGEEYGDYEPEFEDEKPVKSERKTKLSSVARLVRAFQYEYDFGDGWRHLIEIESVGFADEKITYPVCIGGERACPPEDCGGIYGYQDTFLPAISDPANEEHESTVTWCGGFFDPTTFDPNRVNRELRQKRKW